MHANRGVCENTGLPYVNHEVMVDGNVGFWWNGFVSLCYVHSSLCEFVMAQGD